MDERMHQIIHELKTPPIDRCEVMEPVVMSNEMSSNRLCELVQSMSTVSFA